MKRTILAAALLAAASAANAVVTWVPSAAVNRTEAFNVAGMPSFAVGTALTTGDLLGGAGSSYLYKFTYLGEESGYKDKFHLVINGTSLTEANAVGDSISALAGPGYADFKFEGDVGKFAINGGAKHPAASIGLIGTNMLIGTKTYDFVLGYNDSAGSATLGDWDDFVVGVNVTAVPEPETYALMLAGLGVVGFVARRRRNS
jgi:hypothetical protein